MGALWLCWAVCDGAVVATSAAAARGSTHCLPPARCPVTAARTAAAPAAQAAAVQLAALGLTNARIGPITVGLTPVLGAVSTELGCILGTPQVSGRRRCRPSAGRALAGENDGQMVDDKMLGSVDQVARSPPAGGPRSQSLCSTVSQYLFCDLGSVRQLQRETEREELQKQRNASLRLRGDLLRRRGQGWPACCARRASGSKAAARPAHVSGS